MYKLRRPQFELIQNMMGMFSIYICSVKPFTFELKARIICTVYTIMAMRPEWSQGLNLPGCVWRAGDCCQHNLPPHGPTK